MYPPGWPALLAVGVLAGAPWIVNPILHGLLCVMTSMLAGELYGPRVGRVAGLLMLMSPLFTIMNGEFLSSTASTLFLCICAWAVCRWMRTGAARFGAWSGAAWGVAFLCRPLSALVVGALLALYPLVEWRLLLRAWRGAVIALLLAGSAACLLAGFQKATTGSALTPGHVVGMGSRGRMGFGKLDAARTHTPALAWEYSLRRLRNVNHHLLSWPVPFFAVALAPFVAGRAGRREAWLLAPTVGLLAAFAPYWYYDMYYPSQYIAEGLPLLLALAARAVSRGRDEGTPPPAWALPVVLSGIAFTALVSGPAYARSFHDHYGDVESVLPNVVREYGIANAVVFMDQVGEGTDQHDPRNKYYATGFMLNNLTLDGDVVYALNLRDENPVLMQAYPGRCYYLYRFNRSTGRARLYVIRQMGEAVDYVPVIPTEDRWLEEAPDA